VISVTVPTTGSITVNPYQVNVQVGSSTTSTAQIIHQAQSLVNSSACDVSVNVTATCTLQNSSSTFTFSSLDPTITSKSKSMKLYVEFGTDQNWAASYDENAANQLLIRSTSTSKSNVMTLAANGGTGYFHFDGSVSAGDYPMWSDDTDAFTVTLAFTFTALNTGTEDENQDEPQAVSDEDLDDESMIQPSDEPLADTSIISGSDNTAATPADNATQPAAPTDTEDEPSQSADPAQSGENDQDDQSADTGDNQVQSQGAGDIIEVTPDDAGNTSEDSAPET
jgi:hypothetical protein